MINATASTHHAAPTEGAFPPRGRVGMFCLIATEAALFTIFVVAYLFYIGKSLSGPSPAQVLEVPILPTICLLASSATIMLAERALRRDTACSSVAGGSSRFSWAWSFCMPPRSNGTG